MNFIYSERALQTEQQVRLLMVLILTGFVAILDLLLPSGVQENAALYAFYVPAILLILVFFVCARVTKRELRVSSDEFIIVIERWLLPNSVEHRDLSKLVEIRQNRLGPRRYLRIEFVDLPNIHLAFDGPRDGKALTALVEYLRNLPIVKRPHHPISTPSIAVALALIIIHMLYHSTVSLNPSMDPIAWGAWLGVLIQQGEVGRLLTYALLHSHVIHLIFNIVNLLFLWHALEPSQGKASVAAWFVSGVVVSGFVCLFLLPEHSILIGASGGIYSLIGAYLYLGIKRPPHYVPRFVNITPNVLIYLLVVIAAIDMVHTLLISEVRIGMEAHLAGLVWGFAIAHYSHHGKPKQRFNIAVAASTLVLGVTAAVHQLSWDTDDERDLAIYWLDSEETSWRDLGAWTLAIAPQVADEDARFAIASLEDRSGNLSVKNTLAALYLRLGDTERAIDLASQAYCRTKRHHALYASQLVRSLRVQRTRADNDQQIVAEPEQVLGIVCRNLDRQYYMQIRQGRLDQLDGKCEQDLEILHIGPESSICHEEIAVMLDERILQLPVD